jgi:hypothetical protein
MQSTIPPTTTDKKTMLGQFYTTEYDYILQSFKIPDNVSNIIEPFCGHGHLLDFISDKNKYTIQCYDIDPHQDYITHRDTLINPPSYNDQFILTNPPYLARNKCDDKKIFDKYGYNDLYKCFIKSIIDDTCIGGIVIIPLNFISSIRKNDIELRKQFFEKYDIINLNIFEEKVFTDTSYAICSMLYSLKKSPENSEITCNIYPSKRQLSFTLNKVNNYIVGGDIYNLETTGLYRVSRATRNTKDEECITNIVLKCIDDNANSKIRLKMVGDDKKYVDNTLKLSARSYASLVITPIIDITKQLELVDNFNKYLDTHREKYNSLFITNYRESNSIARKRISFTLAFQIVSYLLNHHS